MSIYLSQKVDFASSTIIIILGVEFFRYICESTEVLNARKKVYNILLSIVLAAFAASFIVPRSEVEKVDYSVKAIAQTGDNTAIELFHNNTGKDWK